ncbi:MAG: hypothetical protein ACHQEM_10450 [Chitinophagales bacterium]
MKESFIANIVATCFLHLTLIAQTETFDLASFVPPKGWQRIEKNGILAFSNSRTNGRLTSFCQIFLFPSKESPNDPMRNFEAEWQLHVAGPTGVTTKPQVNSDKDNVGWTSVVGKIPVTKEGATYTVMLITTSGFGKLMTVMVNIAGQDYSQDVQIFFDSMDLHAPAVLGGLNNGNDRPPESRQGTLDDYLFEPPPGWTGTRYPDGIVLNSPVYNTGEKCSLTIWQMKTAGSDLQKDAENIFAEVFKEYQSAQSSTRPSMTKGISPQGWAYYIIKRPITIRGEQYAILFGFVFVAKLGNQLAFISGISKDQLVSSCFGLQLTDVWPKFFYSLRFKNWAAAETSTLSKLIPGVWIAVTGSAGDRFAFAANGRYAGAAAAQRYYSISSTELLRVTDAYFGDGAWSIKGNAILLTADAEKNKPESGWIRIESESLDAGRSWHEILFLLRKNVADGGEYELAYDKQAN